MPDRFDERAAEICRLHGILPVEDESGWPHAVCHSIAKALRSEGAELDRAISLLSRVQPELLPGHDGAERMRLSFGLDPVPATVLIAEIRSFLASVCEPARGDVATSEGDAS